MLGSTFFWPATPKTKSSRFIKRKLPPAISSANWRALKREEEESKNKELVRKNVPRSQRHGPSLVLRMKISMEKSTKTHPSKLMQHINRS